MNHDINPRGFYLSKKRKDGPCAIGILGAETFLVDYPDKRMYFIISITSKGEVIHRYLPMARKSAPVVHYS